MRFRLLTWDERRDLREARLCSWHKWFAWTPIRLSSDAHEVRFLERVYRKKTWRKSVVGTYWVWEYADSELDILRIDED